ncbi:PDZ domain-containing protein [Cellulomonas humilata]|uniref:PDZ domain-containing protein n=1 Tax=Cellulomonas humilata TaxID=144055 RepID=A0A7Y5ZYL7_9CELL|nr:trypsin-like peptidase domain-containing protein [Cellulomonas humilata]NUU15933.1 PDZ domain-containing protein [Cellulomonas humilata]
MTTPDDVQPVPVPAGEAPASPFASPSGRRTLPPTPDVAPAPVPDAAPVAEDPPARAEQVRPPGTHWSVPHGSVPSAAPTSPFAPPNPSGPAAHQPAPESWAGVPYAATDVPSEPAPGPSGVPHTVVLHRKRRRTLSAAWLVPLLVLALAAGAIGGVVGSRLGEDDHLADAGLPLAAAGSNTIVRAPESVAGIAAGVLPSVVSIQVDGPEGSATGSGFVLRGDGYLVTNNHVIAQADDAGTTITVTFGDGSEQEASIVGRTSDYDLAVLKVDVQGLTPLLLGDSDEVVVGDAVVAVGAPLGLAGTVTTGIVSALNRPVSAGESEDPDDQAFINAIQTDAAINPGNSGGPLVNAAGEVIGINSAIAQPPGSTSLVGGSIGLGFAIPSNQVRRTSDQLIETGHATYPIIGVLLDQRYTGEGVQVSSSAQEDRQPVTADGPAERAGIHPGDVILAIDGRPVTDPDELIVAIRARTPGDTIVLHVRSGSSERDVRVKLDESPTD